MPDQQIQAFQETQPSTKSGAKNNVAAVIFIKSNQTIYFDKIKLKAEKGHCKRFNFCKNEIMAVSNQLRGKLISFFFDFQTITDGLLTIN
ncbi:hypothetical protein AAFH68_17090 [Flavobacterium sp. CGRL1]